MRLLAARPALANGLTQPPMILNFWMRAEPVDLRWNVARAVKAGKLRALARPPAPTHSLGRRRRLTRRQGRRLGRDKSGDALDADADKQVTAATRRVGASTAERRVSC